jgi:hypothetical protein
VTKRCGESQRHQPKVPYRSIESGRWTALAYF